VLSVNGAGPDGDGNVLLAAADVGALAPDGDGSALTGITHGQVSGLGSAALAATSAFDAAGAADTALAAAEAYTDTAVSGAAAAAGPPLALNIAIANRNSARADIPVIGDSVTEGQGATAFTSRWAAQANNALRAAYPTAANGSTGGLGFIPVQSSGESSYTWPVTVATGAIGESFDLGPVRALAHLFGTCTLTWTAPAGTTSVKVSYFDAPVAGAFSYKVGSGSPTTVSNTSTGADILTASIPIASGQVLTIAYVSGDAFVSGIMHFAGDEARGVTIHGCGHFGWTVADWAAAEVDDFDWAQALVNSFPNTVALGIMLGINDADTGGGNRTASEFGSDLAGLISTIRGSSATQLATVPLLLIAEYAADVTVADAGGWPAYVAAVRAVAADDGNAFVIDLSARMPTIASGFDGGVLYADGDHPTNLGHALAGAVIAGALEGLPPAARPSPVYTGSDGLAEVTTPAGLVGKVQAAAPAATSAVTVASTNAIASLGSLTVKANDPVAGAKYKVTAHGTLSIASAGTATTYVCDLRWGGTGGTLLMSLHSTSTANSPLFPNSTALSAVPVVIEGEIEFRTATTAVGWLRMTWTNSTTAATAATVSVTSITSPVTVTTSSDEALSLDWTWGTNSASNTITIASSSFERVS
jgi:hypothetical protein